MGMNELNPEDGVVSALHDHWYKIAALIMVHFDAKRVDLRLDRLAEKAVKLSGSEDGEFAVAATETPDGRLILELIPMVDAKRIALLRKGSGTNNFGIGTNDPRKGSGL